MGGGGHREEWHKMGGGGQGRVAQYGGGGKDDGCLDAKR